MNRWIFPARLLEDNQRALSRQKPKMSHFSVKKFMTPSGLMLAEASYLHRGPYRNGARLRALLVLWVHSKSILHALETFVSQHKVNLLGGKQPLQVCSNALWKSVNALCKYTQGEFLMVIFFYYHEILFPVVHWGNFSTLVCFMSFTHILFSVQ